MLIGLGCNIEGRPCATTAALELNFNSNRAYYLCYDCLADASAMLVPLQLLICSYAFIRQPVANFVAPPVKQKEETLLITGALLTEGTTYHQVTKPLTHTWKMHAKEHRLCLVYIRV